MTGERIVPGSLGLKTFHTLGSSGWKPDVDNNFLLLSALTQLVAKSYTTFIPGSPPDGDIYIVPSSAGSDPNKIYVRDNGAWTIIVPQNGWLAWLQDEQRFVFYRGANSTWEYLDAFPDTVGQSSYRNVLSNASFESASKGTSFTATGSEVADTWFVDVVSGSFASSIFSYAGGVDLPEGSRKYLSLATTGNSTLTLRQRFSNSRRFNGRKVTVSFYARVGSGAATVTPKVTQFFGTGGSATVSLTGTTATMTGSFVRFSSTFSLASTSSKTITDGSDYFETAFTIVTTGATNLHFACPQSEQGEYAKAFERKPPITDYLMSGLGLNINPTNGYVGLAGYIADTSNDFGVQGAQFIFNNKGSDARVVVNKAATANEASWAFKNASSLRAIVGLLNDDNLAIKVSPDGSTFLNGVIIDKTKGFLTYDNQAAFAANRNGVSQTGIADGVSTKVLLTTKEFDRGSFFDTSNSRYTPPAGLYLFSGNLYLQPTSGSSTIAAGSAAAAILAKNGSTVAQVNSSCQVTPAGARFVTFNFSALLSAGGSDYFELFVIWITSNGETYYVYGQTARFWAIKVA